MTLEMEAFLSTTSEDVPNSALHVFSNIGSKNDLFIEDANLSTISLAIRLSYEGGGDGERANRVVDGMIAVMATWVCPLL